MSSLCKRAKSYADGVVPQKENEPVRDKWRAAFDHYIAVAPIEKEYVLNKVYHIITEELGCHCGMALIDVIEKGMEEKA